MKNLLLFLGILLAFTGQSFAQCNKAAACCASKNASAHMATPEDTEATLYAEFDQQLAEEVAQEMNEEVPAVYDHRAGNELIEEAELEEANNLPEWEISYQEFWQSPTEELNELLANELEADLLRSDEFTSDMASF